VVNCEGPVVAENIVHTPSLPHGDLFVREHFGGTPATGAAPCRAWSEKCHAHQSDVRAWHYVTDGHSRQRPNFFNDVARRYFSLFWFSWIGKLAAALRQEYCQNISRAKGKTSAD